ncbi:hypothetical protein LEP1GSC104_0837 [Leptospira interrogans str. UI 12621]|uniref:Uncharacterized protein n=1 Tax=Leptospira interrogans str. UI 12621 TaxID=1049937 RepID=A0A0F6HC29_LEPIR|nr:hypothetical protein LEP1GSC104_0837 [Leptospira interrogans str. UI 12621]
MPILPRAKRAPEAQASRRLFRYAPVEKYILITIIFYQKERKTWKR